jgi:hypothetical protein
MNRRIIQKILKAKHEELCNSIANEELRELVKKNSIITGGSIVSLLIGEPVKDFDFYFRNKETVEAVANYYVNKFNSLNPNCDVKPVVVIEKDRVRIKIQSAGITSEEGADQGNYKYFESQPEGAGQDYVEQLTEACSDQTISEQDDGKEKYRPVFLSDNAITLSNKVQLVIRFYGEAEEIHKNYDFVHCTNYWTSWDKKLVLRPAAMESILSKELYYVGSLYPVCSVIRTRKFLKRGWHINAGQFLKMCFQISELDLSDIIVLQDQLTGVDAAYFIEIIDYCKKKQELEPDFKVTMPYLCAIVDKIFGKCEE